MPAIRLPLDIETRLATEAERTGRSVDDLARDAIIDYLRDLDGLAEADRRMAELHAGRDQIIPLRMIVM